MKFKEFIDFVIIFLIQILLINNFDLLIITPVLYIYILAKLPFSIPSTITLIIGFVLGSLFDLSVMTPGIHAFTAVCVVFLRLYIRNIFISKDLRHDPRIPVLYKKGNLNYFLYVTTLVIIYYSIWQIIDGMLVISIIKFISNIIFGTTITMLLILIFDRLFVPVVRRFENL